MGEKCNIEYRVFATLENGEVVELDNSKPIEMKQKGRLVCEYCGCISDKDHGTCEHCGAVLTEPKSEDLYEVMKRWW